MKKILLVAAVAGLAMVSCKKDYTCECTVTSTMPGYTGVKASSSTGKMKKADAESKCNQGDASTTAPGFDEDFNMVTYNYTTECSIKE